MNDAAIKVSNLSKRYRITAYSGKHSRPSLRESISNIFARPFRSSGGADSPDMIYALKDVSFEVERGELVGLIGNNGAGKSTALKILSRITAPTSGRVELRGRVASLLEVGTGFNLELSGRENIFLNGAILGMTKREIASKFDDIVAFSEIEKFIDTPVKRYSSGMFVRLAFAVAAHLNPEILLVDEVLAVGDAEFQKKCLGKMGEVAKGGRTVIFVSHNLQAVSTLTTRALVLNAGTLFYAGKTSDAITKYRETFQGRLISEYSDESKSFGVTRARITTSEPGYVHRFGKPLVFEFTVRFKERPKNGTFSFQIVSESDQPIVHLWIIDSEKRWAGPGEITLRCIIENPLLYMGRYRIATHLSDLESPAVREQLDNLCPFEVVMEGMKRDAKWYAGACAYLEKCVWEVKN